MYLLYVNINYKIINVKKMLVFKTFIQNRDLITLYKLKG